MRLRQKPKFRGRFFTWRASLSIDREKGTEELLLVFSSGKREAVRRHLWLKLVWAELSRAEFQLFIVTLGNNEDKKWAFLKALLNVPRKTLRKRLLRKEIQLGEKLSSLESYRGSRRIRIETQELTRRLPRTAKYTGYVRSIASLGKSSTGSNLSIEELMTTGFVDKEIIDWFQILTVGEIPS
jgi:hypothetical protein